MGWLQGSGAANGTGEAAAVNVIVVESKDRNALDAPAGDRPGGEQSKHRHSQVDLKRTFIEARDWPKFRAGYFNLFKFIAFCALYLNILLLQLDAGAHVYRIDEALRQSVVDEQGSLQDVTDHASFFDYLQNTIMPNVFPSEWYNEQPLNTQETGYILQYNKLVGGLLLTQNRGTLRPACKIPFYQAYPSSYETFYGKCFSDDSMAIHVTQDVKLDVTETYVHPQMRWDPFQGGAEGGSPGWTAMVPWTTKIVRSPITTEEEKQACLQRQKKRDPRLGTIYKPHGVLNSSECIEVVEDEPCPPLKVNLTRQNAKEQDFFKAFTYHVPKATRPPSFIGYWQNSTYGKLEPQETDGSYRSFLALSDGPATNLLKVSFLKKHKWLDKFTRGLNIKFAVFNGMYGTFTFVNVMFGFSTTGAYRDFDSQGGTLVKIKSVNMEPYRVRQRGNCTVGWTPDNNQTCYEKHGTKAAQMCKPCARGKAQDEVQLGLEIIMMVWCFYEICAIARRFISAFLVGWQDKPDPKLKDEILPGLKTLLCDFWLYLDVTNYILFTMWIVVRVSLISMILAHHNAIKIPSNKYEMVLEYAYSITQKQLLMNFFNIVLCLVRMFKFYRFQPRLAVVNGTLAKAGPDLFHFMLMFLTVLYGFAVITNILFGPQMPQYSSLARAFDTGFAYMNTAAPDIAKMSNVNGIMAMVWYTSFMFLVTIVLLNVLLAILVDSYLASKEEQDEKWKQEGYDTLPSMIDQIISWNLVKHLTTFGAIHEDLLLRILEQIKNSKEAEHECVLWEMSEKDARVTISDIYNAIPLSVRESGKLTMETIARSPFIRWSDYEDEDGDGGDIVEPELAPDDIKLYEQIRHLVNKNAQLHFDHRQTLIQGGLGD